MRRGPREDPRPVQAAAADRSPSLSAATAVVPKKGNGIDGGAEPSSDALAPPDDAAIATGHRNDRKRSRGGTAPAIIPRTLDQVYRVARAVRDAKLAPFSYTHERGAKLSDAEAIARLVVGIMKGAELGFPPITALSAIAIINQKPCLYGDGASALIQSRGHLDSMTVEEIGTVPEAGTETRKFADDYGVRVTLWRKGQRAPYIGQFTVGDAKRARLWMDPHREPWIKYPRRQLKWRAFSWPARDGFADDLMGLGIAEEMLDVPPNPPPKTDTSFLDDSPSASALLSAPQIQAVAGLNPSPEPALAGGASGAGRRANAALIRT